MSSIIRGSDGFDTANVATDVDLANGLALKADVIVANDSQVKTALNATGSAPIYACRAWVNFNGTGTVAIRASGNVSSITDVGVGSYKLNFVTPMIDTSFVITGTWSFYNISTPSSRYALGGNPDTTSKAWVVTTDTNAALVDVELVNVAVFR